jgi:hypothetical protein
LRLVVAHFGASAVCAAAGGVLLAAGFADTRDPLHRETLAVMHLAGRLVESDGGRRVAAVSSHDVGRGVAFIAAGMDTLRAPRDRRRWTAAAFLTGLPSRFAPIAGTVLWRGLVFAAIHLGSTLLRSRERTVWRAGALLALAYLVVTPSLGCCCSCFSEKLLSHTITWRSWWPTPILGWVVGCLVSSSRSEGGCGRCFSSPLQRNHGGSSPRSSFSRLDCSLSPRPRGSERWRTRFVVGERKRQVQR